RPHHGVDYGAPVGTPVMTTADGVVVEAGRKRGEGNFIRIRHSARIATYYLHLSRFAKGVTRGAKVTQGQVIGYIGRTGLATGRCPVGAALAGVTLDAWPIYLFRPGARTVHVAISFHAESEVAETGESGIEIHLTDQQYEQRYESMHEIGADPKAALIHRVLE